MVDEAATEKVLETILKIKRRDPAVYDPEAHFFDEFDNTDAGKDLSASKRRRSGKAVLLKDVLAQQVRGSGAFREAIVCCMLCWYGRARILQIFAMTLLVALTGKKVTKLLHGLSGRCWYDLHWTHSASLRRPPSVRT